LIRNLFIVRGRKTSYISYHILLNYFTMREAYKRSEGIKTAKKYTSLLSLMTESR